MPSPWHSLALSQALALVLQLVGGSTPNPWLYPNILLNAVSKRPFSVPSIILITLTNALLSYTETQYA
jgi:hypothetical protein